ncbi:MAG: hypothetical protein HDR12_05385 [Lachnospiraceae bacterium]|nr:hypothetical protein [Lachnospiraceae bacterium]
MLHILPRIEYSINSTKSPEDINAILNSVTVPRYEIISDSANVEYTGDVNPLDFRIIEEVAGRFYIKNDFKPVIVGNIRTERGLSVIDIKMRLRLPTLIILSVCHGVVGIYFLGGLIAVFTKGMDGVTMLLFSVVIFTLLQVIVRIGFYFPTKYQMKKLEELLK